MTIGAWGTVAGIFVAGVFVSIFIYGLLYDICNKTSRIRSLVITLVITVIICGVFIWYRSNSASGQRALKDQQSNLNGGIERVVSVYDINGDLIEQYEGKFDIETDKESYILFDDENGKRHIIYYTTGTIIVDEK